MQTNIRVSIFVFIIIVIHFYDVKAHINNLTHRFNYNITKITTANTNMYHYTVNDSNNTRRYFTITNDQNTNLISNNLESENSNLIFYNSINTNIKCENDLAIALTFLNTINTKYNILLTNNDGYNFKDDKGLLFQINITSAHNQNITIDINLSMKNTKHNLEFSYTINDLILSYRELEHNNKLKNIYELFVPITNHYLYLYDAVSIDIGLNADTKVSITNKPVIRTHSLQYTHINTWCNNEQIHGATDNNLMTGWELNNCNSFQIKLLEPIPITKPKLIWAKPVNYLIVSFCALVIGCKDYFINNNDNYITTINNFEPIFTNSINIVFVNLNKYTPHLLDIYIN